MSFAPITTIKDKFLKELLWLNSTDTRKLQSLTETGAMGALESNQFGKIRKLREKKVKLPLRGYYLVSVVLAGLQMGSHTKPGSAAAEMEICQPSEALALK